MADRVLLAGRASGPALVLDEPLSMWGGLNPDDGRIIDPHHPQVGEVVTGTVLVMPTGRGSSSSSSVLAEAIRRGTAPAAVVLAEPDSILLVGAIVAEELYGITCPVVVTDAEKYASIVGGETVEVGPEGVITTEGC